MLSWRIGDVTVTRILEMEEKGIIGSDFLLPDATPPAVRNISWLQPHFADAEGRLMLSFHGLLVQAPACTILVDTCVGSDKQRGIPTLDKLRSPFLERLADAGHTRESVDVVVCTHLHIDHVGWNTMLQNDRWVPTFPNARFLIDRTEFEHWRTQEQDAVHRQVFVDSVEPVLAAGLVDLVDKDHRICDEVSLVPTPGHTAGHVSVHIASKGQEALITGDFVHHPCQFAHPEWSTTFDFDSAQSAATRRQRFNEACDRGLLMIGTHFMPPTAGTVIREGESFRFQPTHGASS